MASEKQHGEEPIVAGEWVQEFFSGMRFSGDACLSRASNQVAYVLLTLPFSVSELRNASGVILQWFEVLDGLLGSKWKAAGLAFNCTFLLCGSMIQLIACARIQWSQTYRCWHAAVADVRYEEVAGTGESRRSGFESLFWHGGSVGDVWFSCAFNQAMIDWMICITKYHLLACTFISLGLFEAT